MALISNKGETNIVKRTKNIGVAMDRRPTLMDLSREVGLSKHTISHILNGNGDKYRHSKETHEKVLAAARRLNYLPNAMARAARSGRFGNIGLILCSDIGLGYLPDSLMRGIQEEVNRRGINLVFSWVSEELLLKGESIPKILSELMVDGILLDYIKPPPQIVTDMINDTNTPFVLINAGVENDCVDPDDYQAGLDAAHYLIGLGHSRIAYVSLDRNEDDWANHSFHRSVAIRYDGYRKAMGGAGLKPRLITGNRSLWDMADRHAGSPRELLPWLFEKDRPTAIIVYPGAYGVPTILKSIDEMGLHVPNDLSIITFWNSPYKIEGFPVTTMIEPFYEVGKASVGLLLDKIGGKVKTSKTIRFPFEMASGASCASLSRSRTVTVVKK